MAKILIAGIGGGKKTGDGKYTEINYSIGDKIYENRSFITSALEEHFNIDKTIYIGTTGSMWDNLYEHYCKKYDVEYNEEYAMYLMETIDRSNKEIKNLKIEEMDLTYFNEQFKDKVEGRVTNFGINENEIFENFNIIMNLQDVLNDGDKVYIDITHSFRSNAIWMFLVLNFILDVMEKDIEIKMISYGMFEIKDKNNGVAPIIDLGAFYKLMKWIKGAHSLKNYGNGELICELLEDNTIKNKINNLSKALNINYISSLKESINSLEENYKLIEEIKGQAKVIIPSVVREFLNHFKGVEEDYEMFLRLAMWHYKEKRYALAYTNTQEAFISYAKINGLSNEKGVKKDIDEMRNQFFAIEIIKSGEKEKRKLKLKNKYNKFLDGKTKGKLKDFFESYEYCRQIRNNIAHSDDKRNSPDADIKSLEKILKFLENTFKEKYFLRNCKEKADLY